MRFLTGMAARPRLAALPSPGGDLGVARGRRRRLPARRRRSGCKSFWPTAKAAGVSRSDLRRGARRFRARPGRHQARRRPGRVQHDDLGLSRPDGLRRAHREGKAALAASTADCSTASRRATASTATSSLAIWGIESHYGAVFDNPRLVKSTIRSLATLAYTGGRLAKFGRQQLVAALKILQRGDVTVDGMTGSWAGAMGQTQFIPTTFNAYAVDFDGDGHRNIWTSIADALASTANYLEEVRLADRRDLGLRGRSLPAGFDIKKTSERVARRHGRSSACAAPTARASRARATRRRLLPAERRRRAGLPAAANFRVIKRYNNANFYALAVGHLADRLRGDGPFVGRLAGAREAARRWTSASGCKSLLTMRGLYDGDIDGEIGSGSRAGDPRLPAPARPDAGRRGDPRPVAAAAGGQVG